jgi:hypothetical protein
MQMSGEAVSYPKLKQLRESSTTNVDFLNARLRGRDGKCNISGFFSLT